MKNSGEKPLFFLVDILSTFDKIATMKAQIVPIGNGMYAVIVNGVEWYSSEFATSCMIWCADRWIPFTPWGVCNAYS